MTNNERLAEVRRLLCAEASVKNWALLMLHHQQAYEAGDEITFAHLKEHFAKRYFWMESRHHNHKNELKGDRLCTFVGTFAGENGYKWFIWEVIANTEKLQVCSMAGIGAWTAEDAKENIKTRLTASKWRAYYPREPQTMDQAALQEVKKSVAPDEAEEAWGSFLDGEPQDVPAWQRGFGPNVIGYVQNRAFELEQGFGIKVKIEAVGVSRLNGSVVNHENVQFLFRESAGGDLLAALSFSDIRNGTTFQTIPNQDLFSRLQTQLDQREDQKGGDK